MRSEIAALYGGDTRGVMVVRPPTGRPRKKRLAAMVCGLVLAAGLGLASAPAALAVNPDPVQYYYVPFPEDQLLSAFSSINAAALNPITSYIAITAIANGTLIYYDQWENGYDIDIANPANLYKSGNPGGTQIWGDGNAANGTCPGTTNDLIYAGQVIILSNAVDTSTMQTIIDYDGRDKIAASKTIALTRTSWATGSSTLLAGSVEVFDLYNWGTDYRSPVGVDMPDTTDFMMFEYTALSIMAGPDGATVQIDAAGDGTFETTVTLKEGESTYVTGVYAGGHVVSDNPVQVDIFTGDIGSNYESRDSALIPTGTWSSDYYTPVSTVSSAQGSTGTDTTVWLFNSGTSAITVNYKRWVSGVMTTGTVPVLAGSYAKQVLTDGTGAEFYTSNGAPFYAFSTTDSNNSTVTSGRYDGNQAWDWGFSLIPKGRLSTQLLVGLGIGRDPTSPTSPYENGNPVWVTPSVSTDTATATVYVDYDGDPATGANTDPNGRKYDVSYGLKNLQRARIYRGGVQAEAESSATTTGSTTLSWPHTAGPTANLMLVGVAIGNASQNATVSSVTYGTQSLSPVATIAATSGNTGRPRTAIYALPNPTKGTANVTVTVSASRPFTAGATTFSGADVSNGLTSALRTAVTASNTGTTGTMTVSPASVIGDGVYAVAGIGNSTVTANDPVVGPGQLRRWTQAAVGGSMHLKGVSSTTTASATTTTMTETQNGGPYAWSMIGVAIKPISTVMNQSGMLIYSIDPTVKLAGAWGQDPLTSNASAPGLDVGTSVPPMPEISAGKDAALHTDNDSDGYLGPGDVIEYAITVYNVCRMPVPDVIIYDTIPTGTTYVPNSTYIGTTFLPDDTSGSAFPLDGSGYNVGSLAYGQARVATFQVTINSYGSLGGLTKIDNSGTGSALNVIIPVKERSYIRGRLGDYVWYDANANGIQDTGEEPLPGVTVRLLNSGGSAAILDDSNNPVTAITGADGKYLFKGLYANTYTLQFDVPANYEASFTLQDQGGDATDSDANATGRTGAIPLGGGQELLTVDAGLVWAKPTLAVVSSFDAYLVNGKVVLNWETASEVGTAGFYVERRVGESDKWVRVNGKIIPALFESASGGFYSVVDKGAKQGTALTYRLVEVETSGELRTYGPYQVTAVEAMPSGEGSAQISSGEQTARIPKLTKPEVSHESEHGDDPAVEATPGANRLRIEVVQPGLYRIDLVDIVTGLGLTQERASKSVLERRFKLTTRGENVAYLPATDGSALFFYGQSIDSIYTSTNVYWLTLDKGTTMESAKNTTATKSVVASFVDSVHSEQDLFDSPGSFHDPEGDFWLWQYLVAGDPDMGAVTVTVDAPGVLSGVTLRLTLQALNTSDVANEHHVSVRLNGTTLGETQWTGAVAHEASFSIPEGVLQAGENQVELVALLDGGVELSIVGLDSLDLTYERAATALADQLLLKSSSDSSTIRVDGLSSAEAWVLDLATPLRPRVVPTTEAGGEPGAAWLSFNAAKNRQYLVATAAGALRPLAITAVEGTLLRAAKRGADYVVITTSALSSSATALADYRAGQGLKTAVVTMTDIYDEFNNGIANPHAIQTFLKYARAKWKPAPSYVVLAGEGSYDFKNRYGLGDSLVPPLLVDTASGLATSDVLLGDTAGEDGVPEVAIGRIPVLDEVGLDAAIDKIKAYEAADGEWRQSVVFVADGADDGGAFATDSDNLAASLPSSLTVSKAYLDEMSLAQAREKVSESFTSGSLLVNYLGHAGVDQLAAEGLLTSSDAATLTGTSFRLPVLTAFTCVAGIYGFPGYDGLGEVLVKRADAGAIAVWAPTAMEDNEESVLLNSLFLQKMFGPSRETTLGKAILAAQKAAAGAEVPAWVIRTYNLLGDPALRVRW